MRDALIIFEGISNKTKKPYTSLGIKYKYMFDEKLIAKLKKDGVKVVEVNKATEEPEQVIGFV